MAISGKDRNYTRINPDGVTYRIPVTLTGITFTLSTDNIGTSLFGDIANRLGRYENCGLTIEEIEEHARRIGKLNTDINKKSWG